MKVPTHVQELCNQYLIKLNNKDYQFKAIERANLYRSFGTSEIKVLWDWPYQMRRISMSTADAAYGWLGVITSQKVLPIWEQSELPISRYEKINLQKLPSEILELAKGILLGVTDADKSNEFRWIRDYRLDLEIAENAYYALDTAFASLNTLFYGVAGLVGDFASKALKAYAIESQFTILGEWVEIRWVEQSEKEKINPNKELEFWQWWLSEAVPQAWHFL